ncbi:MAG: type I DNA topoisomerase [Candidatus Marinimicrobia bacterium]|nr:type I DNA topoisomerase [Candidatus Neomarinimicrobiota bacterium]
MAKKLLIVESPSKSRTIRRYLGKDFNVLASIGHIKDLPEKDFGVNIAEDFKPKYVTIKGKGKIIKRLKEAAKESDAVYIATDPDREGEAIAWHISNEISKNNSNTSILRVLFNEITKEGIKKGLKSPRSIDLNLVNAQQARRILDRIVGYQVSPFLWKTIYAGLSAGRVQSVALRLICEREEEIKNFIPEEYWEIEADFKLKGDQIITSKCIKIGGRKPDIKDEKTASQHVERIKGGNFSIDNVEIKTIKNTPPAPFITSTLQQEAARKFYFSPSKTMNIAQQLYEGVDIEGVPVGLITYMRTDSVRIANEAIHNVRKFIKEKYGSEYLPKYPRQFKKANPLIQDAHEAIRPTDVSKTPDSIRDYLTDDQYKLYSLIWSRFIACQMSQAQYERTIIDIAGGEYLFRYQAQRLTFDGFLRVYRESSEEGGSEKVSPQLVVSKGDLAELIKVEPIQKFTEPPPRYREGTLIKEMDRLGIGRPSTYATIVSTILQRKYVEKKRGVLYPTELGQVVNQILVNGMPEIFNVDFTARMEKELDKIESGNKEWVRVVREFYVPFKKALDMLNENRRKIKIGLQEKTDQTCELCGAPMVIKWSRKGKFLSCSNYPKCKNARSLSSLGETEKKVCPECGSNMLIKDGKFGRFWACSRYPQCKTTLPYTLGIGCPEEGCDGEIVLRRSGKGKVFYGCSKYPDCKFASWYEPVDQACSNCGYGVLVRRVDNRQGNYLECPRCKSKYKENNI